MDLQLLKSVRSFVSDRKSPLPVLSNFYIDREFLWMSNLDITVRLKHHFVFAEGSGPALIDSRIFIQRVKYIKAPWEIYVNPDLKEKVLFRAINGDTTISGTDPDVFTSSGLMPVLPGAEDRHMFYLNYQDIKQLDIATGFTADDELRPVMMHVAIDKDYIVASDAHKLLFQPISKKHEETVLIDCRVIKLMKLMGGHSFCLTTVKNNYCFDSGDMTIWIRVLDGIKDPMWPWFKHSVNYPNWRSVVPDSDKLTGSVTIPVNETIAALKSIIFAANPASHMVRTEIKGSKLIVSCKDFDFDLSASESIEIWNPGNHELLFGMKYDFIIQVLKYFKNEGNSQVKLAFIDATKAFIFGDKLLLMPMMINE